MSLEKDLIINSSQSEPFVEDFIYLTNKVIKYDNNTSEIFLRDKYDLKDKFKFKYSLNTYELYYNIGIVAKYLNGKIAQSEENK